jgi:hypothetical protein
MVPADDQLVEESANSSDSISGGCVPRGISHITKCRGDLRVKLIPVAAQNLSEGSVKARHAPSPVAMSQMIDFQNALQTRSKVISAIETLLRG